MMAFKSSTIKPANVVIGITALVSLAAWIVPLCAGYATTSDIVTCLLWLLGMVALALFSQRSQRKAENMRRTVYVSASGTDAFSIGEGSFSFKDGFDLIDCMAVQYARPKGRSLKVPQGALDVDTTIETDLFACRHEGVRQSDISSIDDMLVTQWSGTVRKASTGRTYKFSCLADLEDLLCPESAGEKSVLEKDETLQFC